MNSSSRPAIWAGLTILLLVLMSLGVLGMNADDAGPAIAFMAAIPMLAAMLLPPLLTGIVAVATVITAGAVAASSYGQSFADALPIVIGVIVVAGIAVIASQVKATAAQRNPAARPSPGKLVRGTEAGSTSTSAADELTGLPTRADVQEAALDEVRQRPNVVALVDIDDLAGVNATHGHDIGDVFVFAVAGRTRYALGEGDLVARWDGGCFLAILAGDLSSTTDTLELISEKVNANPIRTDTGLVPASVSIGAAPWPLGGDFDEACATATSALHSAKSSGGGCVRAFGRADG